MEMTKAMKLITKAARLNEDIKALEPDLKAAKEELADWWLGGETTETKITGAILNGDRGEAQFVKADVYDPITISQLQTMLATQGKADDLFKCLTVNLTSLKDVLGKADIEKLKGPVVGTKVSIRLKIAE